MDQRAHTRIQVPLAVELTHPALGSLRTVARDISEGGMYVALADHGLQAGAKLKVKVLNVLDTDTQPTPTVDMKVARMTEDGIGLECTNKTAEHLLSSIARVRAELQIGRDYFQVYQSVAIVDDARGILLLQKNGKWVLPGHYLVVGEESVSAVVQYCQQNLGLSFLDPPEPVACDSAGADVAEAATFRVTFSVKPDGTNVHLSEEIDAKDHRWVKKSRVLREITFAADSQRDIAIRVLEERDKTPSAS